MSTVIVKPTPEILKVTKSATTAVKVTAPAAGRVLKVYTGRPGPAGYTPVKGVDYFDGVDGADSVIPGPMGYTPVKGVDYFDGADGADSVVPGPAGYTPIKGVDYFDGEDGADSVVPGPQGDKGDKGDPGEPGADGTGTTQVYVQTTDPALSEPGIWIETGLAPGGTGFSVWFEDGL